MSTLSATTMIEIEKIVRKAMQEGTAIASNIGHTDGHNFTVCITSDLGKALEIEKVANG
jgi:hypothetical protein